jgi:hypothetical protein
MSGGVDQSAIKDEIEVVLTKGPQPQTAQVDDKENDHEDD